MTKKERPEVFTAAQRAELTELAILSDDRINIRNIPEVRARWSGAKRGLFYRRLKQQLTLRIDADVVAWFKGHAHGGKRYQTKHKLRAT